MKQALEALSRDRPPDEEDLVVGPTLLCAEILIEDDRWWQHTPLDVADRVLHAMVANGLAPEAPAACEIVFTTDEVVRALNARYRGKDTPTNVLAFPSGEQQPSAGEAGMPRSLGSVALAHDVMMREASDRGISIAHHTTHLTLHGLLHLLGHDHEEEADRVAMEAVEIEVLAGLGISDPYSGS